jgi:hypothetical protein
MLKKRSSGRSLKAASSSIDDDSEEFIEYVNSRIQQAINARKAGEKFYRLEELQQEFSRAYPAIDKYFDKFQSIYEELTGEIIEWEKIPKSVQDFFLTSQALSAKEITELPHNIRVAYLVARKPPDAVILRNIKKQLASYEKKYGMSSEDFYRKYDNSESIYEGSNERVLDFLSWHSDYRRYLELNNASK